MSRGESLSDTVTKVVKTGEQQKLSADQLRDLQREYLEDARDFNEERKDDRQRSVDFMNRMSF